MSPIKLSFSLWLSIFAGTIFAGPFPPSAGLPGSDAVAASDSRFTLWANACDVVRGPQQIDVQGSPLANYGMPANATGPSDATPDQPYPIVSLGDGGTATLTFAQPIGDAPGPDIVVFENAFADNFLELAHVEVSSDGVHFFRFPSISLTTPSATLGQGGSVDPTNVRNLAGKYIAGYGTPFDLAELRNVSPLLDIQRITHVRVVDVVGTNDPLYGSFDSVGHIVIDPYPTPFPSGGFDLDAVGAFSQTTTTFAAWETVQGITNPDPTMVSNGNGVPNLIEYLTGTGVITLTRTASSITASFPRLSYRSGGNLRIETSQDLVHWSVLGESINGAAFTSSNGSPPISESGTNLVTVTTTLPASATPIFFRLSAALVPSP
jgi:hypothetical protein